MPGFSVGGEDPREPEWAERVIDTLSSVIIESGPEDAGRTVLSLHNKGLLDLVTGEALLEQVAGLVPQIVDRMVDHYTAELAAQDSIEQVTEPVQGSVESEPVASQ